MPIVCLRGWRGGALRRPWLLLDLARAPLTGQKFVKWSRGQILRLASALHRRYEEKFSNAPYVLHRLGDSKWSQASQQAVVDNICGMSDCCMDVFTRLLRNRFGSSLLSPECIATIRASLDALKLATDLSERQNSEVNATKPVRSCAR